MYYIFSFSFILAELLSKNYAVLQGDMILSVSKSLRYSVMAVLLILLTEVLQLRLAVNLTRHSEMKHLFKFL